MEEEKKDKVEKTKTSNFKTVQDTSSYKNYDANKKEKTKLGFGRGFLIPFAEVSYQKIDNHCYF